MTSPLCVATGGWCRRVFHYRPPTPMYRNSPPLCTIVLQIPSLMPLKMRKVQLCVEHFRSVLKVSQRRACKVLGQSRSTHRHEPLVRDDEQALTNDIVRLATRFGRYGYRRIAALLRLAGWVVNRKWVERIWRREGLKLPARQPRRGQLWLNDGSCVRLRPERENHVWA